MLIRDEVLEAELSELIGAPGVERAKNLTLLNAADLLADVGRVRVQECLSARMGPIRVAPVRILAHFLAGEGGRGRLRRSANCLVLAEDNLFDCLGVPLHP